MKTNPSAAHVQKGPLRLYESKCIQGTHACTIIKWKCIITLCAFKSMTNTHSLQYTSYCTRACVEITFLWYDARGWCHGKKEKNTWVSALATKASIWIGESRVSIYWTPKTRLKDFNLYLLKEMGRTSGGEKNVFLESECSREGECRDLSGRLLYRFAAKNLACAVNRDFYQTDERIQKEHIQKRRLGVHGECVCRVHILMHLSKLWSRDILSESPKAGVITVMSGD